MTRSRTSSRSPRTATRCSRSWTSRIPALRRLIKNTGVTLGAINRRYGEFGQFVTNANDFFGALASRNDALAETISIFPTFLDESRQTFDRLREFAVDTRPLVRELQPVALQLRPTLRDLGELAPDLEHLFRKLEPVIDESGDTLPGGGEVPALPERLRSVRRGPAGEQAAGRARVALSLPRGAQPDPLLPQLLPSPGGRVLHERRRLAVRQPRAAERPGGPAPLPAPVRSYERARHRASRPSARYGSAATRIRRRTSTTASGRSERSRHGTATTPARAKSRSRSTSRRT